MSIALPMGEIQAFVAQRQRKSTHKMYVSQMEGRLRFLLRLLGGQGGDALYLRWTPYAG